MHNSSPPHHEGLHQWNGKKKKKSHFQKIILINASTFPYSNSLKIMASYWEKNVEYTDTMNNMTN